MLTLRNMYAEWLIHLLDSFASAMSRVIYVDHASTPTDALLLCAFSKGYVLFCTLQSLTFCLAATGVGLHFVGELGWRHRRRTREGRLTQRWPSDSFWIDCTLGRFCCSIKFWYFMLRCECAPVGFLRKADTRGSLMLLDSDPNSRR